MNEKVNRFSELDDLNKRFIVDAIIYAIKAGEVTIQNLIDNVPVFNSQNQPLEEAAKAKIYHELYILLSGIGIIEPETYSDGVPKCIINCTWQIAPDVKELLNEYGYDDARLRDMLGELPTEKKEVISDYLNNPEDHWNSIINDTPVFPEVGKIIVARMYDPKRIIDENKTQKKFNEDMIVAWYDGSDWKIEEPHAYKNSFDLFNSTEISLEKGAVVSHWREATDEEIHNWHHRFDPINTYGFLNVIADKESLDDVYTALIYAHNFMRNVAKSNPGEVGERLAYLGNVLSDLAGCIDRNAGIYNESEDAMEAAAKIIADIKAEDSDYLKESVTNHDYTNPEE